MDKIFYLIGIGTNIKHISQDIIEKIRESEIVLLENYTSLFENWEELINLLKKNTKNLIIANRETIEQKIDNYFQKYKKISVLVIGDPLTATTHFSLIKLAKEKNFEVEIINNISIFNLITRIGLSIYKFGKTISIPFLIRDKRLKIETPIKTIKDNLSIKAHTLLLMDLDTEKQDFLRIEEALQYLLENKIDKNIIVCSCIGWKNERILLINELNQNKIEKIKKMKLNYPMCLIVFHEDLNKMEKEALNYLERI